jgi:hypothetical protein
MKTTLKNLNFSKLSLKEIQAVVGGGGTDSKGGRDQKSITKLEIQKQSKF